MTDSFKKLKKYTISKATILLTLLDLQFSLGSYHREKNTGSRLGFENCNRSFGLYHTTCMKRQLMKL